MKRYLITGASRGIGRAIAEKLVAPDVELLLHGRDTIALADVCNSVKPRCAHVVRLIHDLAVSSGVSDLIASVGSDPLDLIVNNAEGDWPRNKMISAEQVASAVVYALSRPADVAVESITLSSATGNL